MSGADWISLLPLLVTAGSSVAVMLAIAVRRSHAMSALLTLAGLAAALGALGAGGIPVSRQITPLLVLDGYALFYSGLVLSACFVVTLLSYGYLRQHSGKREEYYVLLLLAALGAVVLVWSNHFASLFLGLELLSVSLYALIGYVRDRDVSLEAGIKYLVLAGISSPFVLFGMALLYAESGTMRFSQPVLAGAGAGSTMALAGVGLIVVGIGFKLALVPFHLWTSDVYEGAPAPLTAFIATASKGAVFALLLRLLAGVNFRSSPALVTVFTVLAIASMFVGNLLALQQRNVKRILAYSSIAHLGYLLVALVAGAMASPSLAATAVTFYLVAYFVTMLGAFGTVAMLSPARQDAGALEDYRGLAWRRPALAGAFTVMLLSLAGIPLTGGFVGKFYVLAAGVQSGLWLLVVLLVVNSAIGLYYYLRIVLEMYRAPLADQPAEPAPAMNVLGGLAMAGLTALLIWLGVYPSTVIRAIQAMVANAF